MACLWVEFSCGKRLVGMCALTFPSQNDSEIIYRQNVTHHKCAPGPDNWAWRRRAVSILNRADLNFFCCQMTRYFMLWSPSALTTIWKSTPSWINVFSTTSSIINFSNNCLSHWIALDDESTRIRGKARKWQKHKRFDENRRSQTHKYRQSNVIITRLVRLI